LFIVPNPAVIKLEQLEVEIKIHPGGQVTHPNLKQRILGLNQGALGLKHLLGQGSGTASIVGGRSWSRCGYWRSEQDGLSIVHLRVAEFHYTLLDSVQLSQGSQFPNVVSDIVGDVILKGHQCPSLSLVTDQSRTVIIAFGSADEGEFRIEGQAVAG
jgi:hypothetical protein